MGKNRHKIKIITNKIFIENMDSYSSDCSNTSSGEKSENFSWIYRPESQKYKDMYILYPFNNWKNILKLNSEIKSLKIGYNYEECINLIFENEVFPTKNFIKGDTHKEIFKLNIPVNMQLGYELQPDFIIKEIEKEKFIDIIDSRNYMFRKPQDWNIPEESKFVTILGEIKSNPSTIKTKKQQKLNYISFCNKINSFQKNIYYMVMYIFDYSYGLFWEKDFFNRDKVIIGYVPKLYNDEYYKIYEHILNEKLQIKQKNDKNEEKQNFNLLIDNKTENKLIINDESSDNNRINSMSNKSEISSKLDDKNGINSSSSNENEKNLNFCSNNIFDKNESQDNIYVNDKEKKFISLIDEFKKVINNNGKIEEKDILLIKNYEENFKIIKMNINNKINRRKKQDEDIEKEIKIFDNNLRKKRLYEDEIKKNNRKAEDIKIQNERDEFDTLLKIKRNRDNIHRELERIEEDKKILEKNNKIFYDIEKDIKNDIELRKKINKNSLYSRINFQI